ncbi:MAG: hypothetical protein KIH63_005235 [Candidatus Saccharibacteria bacterium]|nr:hypothetical protein [Candidatus Saccharibacteria bacterium]
MNTLAKFGIVVGAGALGGFGMDQLMQNRAEDIRALPVVMEECQSGEREIVRHEGGLECDGITIYEQLGTVAVGEPVQIDWYATGEAIEDRIDSITVDRVSADGGVAAVSALVAGLGIIFREAGQKRRKKMGGVVSGRRTGVVL